MDLTQALAPKSDQLDFADLDGSAPRVFTITDVSENGGELADQQPVNIKLAEFPRVWRPSKGMLRVLADNWGKEVNVWVGRKVELYGDPEVYFGKEKRGGTRISRLSHIKSRKQTLVNPRGGKGAYWSVQPLPDEPAAPSPSPLDRIGVLLKTLGVTDRDEALAYYQRLTGRMVNATKDLTGDEMTVVIQDLERAEKGQPNKLDPAAANDPALDDAS